MTPTPQERLRELLQEMERLLPELQDVDPQTRTLAEDARHDLARIVERDERDEPAVAAEEDEGVLDRLTEAESAFEAQHPTLSSVVRRVIDVLAQMGI